MQMPTTFEHTKILPIATTFDKNPFFNLPQKNKAGVKRENSLISWTNETTQVSFFMKLNHEEKNVSLRIWVKRPRVKSQNSRFWELSVRVPRATGDRQGSMIWPI